MPGTRRLLAGHAHGSQALPFARMGGCSYLALSTGRLWNVATGTELQRIHVNDSVFEVAFSADGRMALSGHESGQVRLWNIYRLNELIDWTQQNRYLREFTCLEREVYRIEPLCSRDS